MKLTTWIVSFGIVSWTSEAAFIKPKSLADGSNRHTSTIKRNVAESSEKKGKIVALQLINTITDSKIVDLEDGLVIAVDDIEGMTRPSFNILAVVEDDDEVQSVVFGYKGDDYQRIEYEPYAFCGNDGNNFNKCPRLTYGKHTVTVTPYSEVSAEGEQGETYTVSFSIVQSVITVSPPSPTPEPVPVPVPIAPVPIVVPVPRPVPAPVPVPVPVRVPTPTIQVGEITALELINSNTDTKIMDLTDGTVIAVSDIEGLSRPAFNIKAIVSSAGMVRSVKYVYNRFTFQSIENAPGAYAFCGNNGTNFKRCRRLVYGNHTVTATPYTRLDGRGQAGAPYSVSFSIIPGSTGSTNGTNGDGDVTPPKLIDLVARNGTKVDVTEGRSTVAMEVVVQDDGSGIRAGYIAAYDEEQDLFQSSDSFSLDTPLAGEPLTFVADLIFQQTTLTGKYTLELYLVDAVGNEVDITSENLEARSFPYYIEVINDSIDLSSPKLLEFVALSPTTVNATGDDTVIEFKVVVQDSGSGFRYGYIEASLSRNDFGYITTSFQSLKPISGEPVEFNVTLEIPSFAKPGEYEIQISLSDDEGNFDSIDSDDLEDMNFTSTIEILSSQFENTPPQVLDIIALNSTTVNVTTDSARIELQIVVKENGSGISSCDVSAMIDDIFGPTIYGSSFLDEPLIGNEALINVTLPVPQFSSPGNYSLQVSIYDNAGNQLRLSSDDLEDMDFPSVIQVVNDVKDVKEPELLDFVAISSTTVNVTDGPSTLELQFSVQDDVTGVRNADVTFSTSSYSNSYGIFVDNEVGGEPFVFNYTFDFGVTARPGDYDISIRLYDGIRNDKLYESDDLEELGFPSTIKVINTNKDFDPPKLINLITLSPTTVDVSDGPATVELQVTVQDEGRGFLNGTMELWNYDDDSFANISYAAFAAEGPNSDEPLTFNVTLKIPQYIRSTAYSLQLVLSDVILNTDYISSVTLEDSMYVSEIVVSNTNEDLVPPELVDLIVLSSTTVDVSSGPATFDIQVVAKDDLSGIRAAGLFISTPEDSIYDDIFLDVPVAGENIMFNLTLPFEEGFEEGDYEISVAFVDAANNLIEYDSMDLGDLGFVSSIKITN